MVKRVPSRPTADKPCRLMAAAVASTTCSLENGKVVEHWDVMQEEVPADKAVNGNAMFPVK